MEKHLYRARGMHITHLKSPKSFEHMMFDEPKKADKSKSHPLVDCGITSLRPLVPA